jgi:gliding motility-associated-like protein
MHKIILSSFLIFLTFSSLAQLNVTTVNNGLQLAQKLLGGGVSISNVTFTAANGACGTFNNISSPIQFDSGIVLTTGRAKTPPPPISFGSYGLNGKASDFAGTDNGFQGDINLNSLLSGPDLSEDASVLEFDFVPLGDTVSFNYIFSSEEYPEYNCSKFNDVFAFFISGPGIAGTKNIALIPGTSIPVAINSINDGTVTPPDGIPVNCSSLGAGSPFTNLYISNFGGQFLTHDGLTKRLRAFAIVQPCQTYHLKIAIADVGDSNYDSGVFIEANSLSSNASSCQIQGVFDPTSNSYYLAEGCLNGTVVFTLPQPRPTATTLNLTINGTATNGVDATAIPNSITFPANQTNVSFPITAFSDALNEGTEYLNIYIQSGCNANFFTDSAKIEIRDYEKLFIVPDTAFICAGSSIQLLATNGYTSYTWLPNPTLSSTSIRNPIATPTTSPTTYYCSAVLGTCSARDSATIFFTDLKLKAKQDINCKNGTTGFISVSPGKGWVAPLQFTINNGVPQADSTFNNLGIGTYTIAIKDATNCTKSITVTLVQAYPDLTFTQTILAPGCSVAGTITVTGAGGLAPYRYSLDGVNYQLSNALSISTNGNFTVYIKDVNDCITSKVVNVAVPSVISFNTTVTPASCSGLPDGAITVNVTAGNAPYQYSSDGGITFQNSNILLVTSGITNILIKDNLGCTAGGAITVPLNNILAVNAGIPVTICQGITTTLNGTSNGVKNLWQPNTNIIDSTTLNPKVTPPVTTWYYLTTTTGICSKKDSVLVTVRPAPLPNAGLDTSICYGDAILLFGSGGVQFAWQPNTNINFANTSNPLVNPTQTIKYWLSVIDNFGCKSLVPDTITVTVIPKVIVFAGNDTIVAPNQPVQLSGIANAPSFLWTPVTYLNNPNIANPIATIPVIGTYLYVLKAFTPEGCSGIDSIKVKVYKGPEIYVPTGFTPNGDGKNDILNIVTVGLKELRYFRIFNRWGQLMFETNNVEKGWNGFFKNKEQPIETYVWAVEGVDFLNTTIRKKGTVILIR